MSLFLQAVVILTASTFIVANCDTEPITKESAQEFLSNLKKAFDKDSDGNVSSTELAKGFKNQDADGDDKLDKPELLKYLQTNSPTEVTKVDLLFLLFDTDKTGFIDVYEVQALIQKIDGNSDGKVDDEEFKSFNEDIIKKVGS